MSDLRFVFDRCMNGLPNRRTHCTRHTGVRKFECEHCNARFFTKGDYERHARLHSGAGQFSCTLCATKVFTRHQALKDHMNKHLGRYEEEQAGLARVL